MFFNTRWFNFLTIIAMIYFAQQAYKMNFAQIKDASPSYDVRLNSVDGKSDAYFSIDPKKPNMTWTEKLVYMVFKSDIDKAYEEAELKKELYKKQSAKQIVNERLAKIGDQIEARYFVIDTPHDSYIRDKIGSKNINSVFNNALIGMKEGDIKSLYVNEIDLGLKGDKIRHVQLKLLKIKNDTK